MIEHMTWRRGLVATGTALLLGLTACSGSGESDADDDASPSDSPTSESTEETSAPTPGPPEEEKGGWKLMPECSELAQSIVPDEEVTEGESAEGRSCRFQIGDGSLGIQLAWISRGGDYPEKFKAEEINQLLAESRDDEREWESTVEEIDAPGWAYGVRFDETLHKAERTSFRLFAFSKNGDLLNCLTTADEKHLDEFRSWCGEVKKAVSR